ncbi:MAG: F0F1 ATP synthase subunit A [Verrucomicrobiota bacterium]|jgi:F-type H+-transporting ATPase subunit a
MRLIKIIFACGLLAMAMGVSLKAQPSTTPAPAIQPAQTAVAATTATPAPAETKPGKSLVPEIAPTLFYLFGITWLPVTNSMVCTWIVAAVIFVIVRFSTWNLKEVPTGAQNVMEALIEGWESLTGSVLEPKVARWVFPYATTFFIFIFISNLTDLLPGVGSIGLGMPDQSSSLPFAIEHAEKPFFRPPTTDANLTVAMAAIYFVMSSFWALRYNGPIGLLKHIFGVKVKASKWLFTPLLLLFIFIGLTEMISIVIVRPVALAMRLYGNIFGGENLLTLTLTHRPLILGILSALPFYFFELLVSFLQAFVFAMLTIAFVGTLCTHVNGENNPH